MSQVGGGLMIYTNVAQAKGRRNNGLLCVPKMGSSKGVEGLDG